MRYWLKILVLILLSLSTQGTVMVRRTGVPLTDWCPTSGTGCRASWTLDEAANSTRYATGGSCGADCALTDSLSSVGRNTTSGQFVEGTASADFDAGGDKLYCLDSVCSDSTELGFGGDITFGCWARETADVVTPDVLGKLNLTAFTGFRIRRRYTTNDLLCSIGDGTAIRSKDTADDSWAVNTMYHMVCTHDGVDTITAYIDGVNSGSTPDVGSAMSANTGDHFILSNAIYSGQIDECFVYDADFTDAQVCRATRCGIHGELCMCDATDPTTFKACSIDNDCRVAGNTTAICNTGYCTGRTDYDTCSSMGNCNAGAPT